MGCYGYMYVCLSQIHDGILCHLFKTFIMLPLKELMCTESMWLWGGKGVAQILGLLGPNSSGACYHNQFMITIPMLAVSSCSYLTIA